MRFDSFPRLTECARKPANRRNSRLAWVVFLAGAIAIAEGNVARAAPTLDETTFRQLLLELGPKVNYFQAYWKRDPEAIFVGGPVRDFALWIRGRLAQAEAKGDLAGEIKALRALPSIDVRDFMDPESDLDILTEKPIQLDGSQFGVGKAERIDPDRFRYSTQAGRDEVFQGFLPIEKIRLGRDRIETRFGRPGAEIDAIPQIVARRYSAVFPIEKEFAQTARAIEGGNHPILLALRYLRLVSSDTYHALGKSEPGTTYERVMDPASKAEAEKIFRSSFQDPAFNTALKNETFVYRVNKAISRFMSAGVNTTASWRLGEELGIGELVGQFPALAKLNAFLYIPDFSGKPRTYEGIEAFTSIADEIPSLKVLHGTPTEGRFVKILRQNALPSSSGLAGRGLYVTKEESLHVALSFAQGSRDRIISFHVDPNARFVDITRGPGKAAFDHFVRTKGLAAAKLDAQCEAFIQTLGIDVLKYPYPIAKSHTYVINNSSVLTHRRGMIRNILTFGELSAEAAAVRTLEQYVDFVRTYQMTPLREDEAVEIIRRVGGNRALKEMLASFDAKFDAAGPLKPGMKKAGYEILLAYGALRELANAPKSQFSDATLRRRVFELNGTAFVSGASVLSLDSKEFALIQDSLTKSFAGSRAELQIETLLAEEFSQSLQRLSAVAVKTAQARVVRNGFRQFMTREMRGLMFPLAIFIYLNYAALKDGSDWSAAFIGTVDLTLIAVYAVFTYYRYMQSDFRKIQIQKDQSAARESLVKGLREALSRFGGGCEDHLYPAES